MERSYSIAVIPGDGIGQEVIEVALDILLKAAALDGNFSLTFQYYGWNSKRYLETGIYIPDGGLEALKKHDAVLFGAVGDPEVLDSVSLWGLILPLRQKLKQCINLRPIRTLQRNVKSMPNCHREDIDWIIVRENSEGEYAGQGGITHGETSSAVATEVAIFTRSAIELTMRFAFETARSRRRKMLTMVTKSNAQRYGLVLWDAVFRELATEYPEVKVDSMLVDAMTVRMVNNPRSLDTIVTTNLHGNILSDLAAALAGSIGIASSGNINPDRTTPSMFEPIHGSAPDIAGKGIANPVGMIWSAAEMLRWLGEDKSASMVMDAVMATAQHGVLTKDLGGSASTEEVGQAILQSLSPSQSLTKARL